MKKIMFSDKYGLTKAVLEGRKTQTRRIIDIPEGEELVPFFDKENHLTSVHLKSNPSFILNPSYRVGEEVAIAQSYKDCTKQCIKETGLNVKTKEDLLNSKGYNNKMFVRADLMPYRIKITNVRVEHLQDISVEDCLNEGVRCITGCIYGVTSKCYYFEKKRPLYKSAQESFAALIDKTCGRGTWHSNPYVFVYDFQLIK